MNVKKFSSVFLAVTLLLSLFSPSFAASFSGNGNIYDSINRPAEIARGALGWYVPFYRSYRSYTGNASFVLTPTNTQMPNGSTMASQLNSKYAHNTLSIGGLGLSLSGPSINIDGKYDHASTSTIVSY